MLETEVQRQARKDRRLQAVLMLLISNACWGFSFPGMKALALVQESVLPGSSSWFMSAFSTVFRFSLAGLFLSLFLMPRWKKLTWLEVYQGAGLGLFGGIGLILQMDGLAYTAASTSAFLTQFYCLLIPIIVALRHKRWPGRWILLSTTLVLLGVGILADFKVYEMRLGRGETETLLGSTIFAAQILWLERPIFAKNHSGQITWIMFFTFALVALPVLLSTTRQYSDWIILLCSPAAMILLAVMTVFSSLIAYLLMNTWQPKVTATEAGLIYCFEPIFASSFAMFLPGWFSALAALHYPNETLTWSLLIGGGLITVANVLLQLRVEKL